MVKYIDLKYAKSLFPKRDENANKGSFLKIINFAGSSLYSGAAILSSLSALRVGAGFLTLSCPKGIIQRIAPLCSEITFRPLDESVDGSILDENNIDFIKDYGVVELGCGLTVDDNVEKFVLMVLNSVDKAQKLVVDADGLNILAKTTEQFCIKNAIITPHPKELSRLLKVSLDEILDNREKYSRIAAQKFDCIVVLKGHNTVVTDGNEIFVNTTGNSALAKAGSGDVLTGIISGFLSQHLEPLQAAILGVFLHGLSGDIASDDLSKYSVLASDVIDYLPSAIKSIIMDE